MAGAHKAFLDLPDDVQTAFAIRMLFTHRDVDRHSAEMFLHHGRRLTVRFQGLFHADNQGRSPIQAGANTPMQAPTIGPTKGIQA